MYPIPSPMLYCSPGLVQVLQRGRTNKIDRLDKWIDRQTINKKRIDSWDYGGQEVFQQAVCKLEILGSHRMTRSSLKPSRKGTFSKGLRILRGCCYNSWSSKSREPGILISKSIRRVSQLLCLFLLSWPLVSWMVLVHTEDRSSLLPCLTHLLISSGNPLTDHLK
jgi:hypothetical protein